MNEKYTVEQKFEIWDDENGCKLEIGPDRDGLDLIEFRQYTDDGKIVERMAFTKMQAALIVDVLKNLLSLD